MTNIKAEVARKSTEILRKLMANSKLSHYIPTEYIPSVFMESNDTRNIRLVIVGQDPTVKRESSREKTKTVLNLDKKGSSLYKYVCRICQELSLELSQHVYATNLVKNFFMKPPTQIKECNVLDEFSPYWLPLLEEELSLFPGRPILTLGEPLLAALLIDKRKALVRRYWGYTQNWKQNLPTNFSSVPPEENRLKHRLFPFPHQPSIQKEFYSATLGSYISYVKNGMLRVR